MAHVRRAFNGLILCLVPIGAMLFGLVGVANAQITIGTSAPLAPAYLGSSYCFVKNADATFTCPTGFIQLRATGGTGPYTYAVTSGSLPPGMILRADAGFVGVLDGKPTATGNYSFTVTATDSKGATGTGSFSITVNPSFVASLLKGKLGVPFTAAFVCNAGGASLTGLPPGVFANGATMSGTPTAAGAFTVILTCTNITLLQPFQINGTFTVSLDSVDLLGASNGATSKSVLQVGGQTPGQAFTASASTSSGGPWLSVMAAGPAPGTVTATANPAGLAAGSYTGTIVINTPGLTPPSGSVPVTYTVAPAGTPNLVAAPTSLNYSTTPGAAPTAKTVVLSNAGSGTIGPLNFTVSGQGISVLPASGSITPTAPLTLTVTANPNLSVGTYSGHVLGSTAAGTQFDIPVNLQITLPSFRLAQTGLFLSEFGDGPGVVRQPVSTPLDIYPTAPLNTDVFFLQGSEFLGIDPPGLPIGLGYEYHINAAGGRLNIIPDPAGLSGGDHYGEIFVETPQANVGTQASQVETAIVVLRIVPPNGSGGLFPNYDSATILTGGPKTIAFTWLGTTPLPLTFTADYQGGPAFFDITPAAASVVSGADATVTITPIGVLAGNPNILQGYLVVQPADRPPLQFQIVSIQQLLSPSAIERSAAAACLPTRLIPVIARPLQNFLAIGGLPTQIDTTVIDDCGSFNTAQTVTAQFSNGDPPLALNSVGNGRFTATWDGRLSSNDLAMTITAFSADQSLTGTREIGGALQGDGFHPTPPRIFDGGIVNGGSFAVGAPLSPGSFVSLFGEELANFPVGASTIPLPPTLAGSSVTIGGVPAPILYASDGQVNAIVPYGIPTDGPVSVVVQRDGTIAIPQSIPIVPAAPGIFQYGDRQGVVVGPGAGANLADSSHPVSANQTVLIYSTGLGEVNPPIAAGSLTPPPDLQIALSRTVSTVTATIGGVPAHVDFAGLTPGFAGLCQVNAVVPAGVTAGDRVPVVLTEAGQSSAPVFISVR